MAQKYSAVVIQKQKVSSKVYCVTFKLISPQTIEFMSGQNMMVMMGEGVNRTMSIASPPIENTTLLMAHDISPHGLGSQWTEKLIIGDKATLVAPTGACCHCLLQKKKSVDCHWDWDRTVSVNNFRQAIRLFDSFVLGIET